MRLSKVSFHFLDFRYLRCDLGVLHVQVLKDVVVPDMSTSRWQPFVNYEGRISLKFEAIAQLVSRNVIMEY